MGRQPEEDEPRESIVGTRFSDAGIKNLDRKRGSLPRGEYIRKAVDLAPPEKS